MRKVGPKDSLAEITLRKKLHAEGYRFRLHSKKLPGTPDIVFPRLKKILFVHGCFWHGHDCPLFKWPSSNVKFWRTKIERNRVVDRLAREALAALGWRILTVWECALKGPGRLPVERVVGEAARWLSSGGRTRQIVGRETP